LLVELVIVSISPVPKFDPGPVSYIHCESAPLPEEPAKSSLNTVDQPEGGPGTSALAGVADNVMTAVSVPAAAMAAASAAGHRLRLADFPPDDVLTLANNI
jgi:hypothetical protein